MCVAPHLKGEEGVYVWCEPSEKLPWSKHFSSLLLSADVTNTVLEVGFLLSLTLASIMYPGRYDTPGSMRLSQLVAFLTAASVLRRVYNSYLEAVYFAVPSRRIQPVNEHALKSKRDLNGRDEEQLESLVYHDRLTLISQLSLVMVLYTCVPGFYPADDSARSAAPGYVRVLRLIAHHYLLSFGMYWAHRSLHVVPALWKHIHSIHHWAKHPLSRNTYQDHWFDNFGNALVGEVAAQILLPLDPACFWFSRLFRIMESLEKHAGVSGSTNLAHTAQRWLPFAQMPHHHDWHHEGHKSCNFTFAALGGLWDCVFGTRKTGRASRFPDSATRQDLADDGKKAEPSWIGKIDDPVAVLSPVVSVLGAAVFKLYVSKCIVA
jgi:sterol desaturase/sphingolipid hydroxylase (fatty acid hydroxylase superfamily)